MSYCSLSLRINDESRLCLCNRNAILLTSRQEWFSCLITWKIRFKIVSFFWRAYFIWKIWFRILEISTITNTKFVAIDNQGQTELSRFKFKNHSKNIDKEMRSSKRDSGHIAYNRLKKPAKNRHVCTAET